MGLFDKFKKKQKIDEEALEKICSELKARTTIPAYIITAEKRGKTELFESKFGGIPYWEPDKEYPTDENGEMLYLLAQLNFDRLGTDAQHDLPQKGILQFFVANDDMTGFDYDNPDEQNNFRVVYHENVNYGITEDEVLALDIPVADEDDDIFPLDGEYSLRAVYKTEPVNCEVYFYDELVEEICEELLPQRQKDDFWGYLTEDESMKLMDMLYSDGHKMLGYPHFTQDDPRDDLSPYDTLLLQIDSKDGIMWGDCGVANFFINSEDLKNLDFSKVMYNWDCC